MPGPAASPDRIADPSTALVRKMAVTETSSPVVPDVRLLLRIEEAAERLAIGRSLMYRLVLSGEVQSVPVGRLRRIPCEALTEYVDRLKQEASAAAERHRDHGNT